ncbi:glycoside hydrolase family 2 TIM barrel-domain containing protein [Tenacibaculum sp. TC6]|uniref:glycoside hydrolase family 2 TIM barrel-domain containing protein n=1 Tax=Tenacibaculum sp. TC6 TaxID=3423223 RepID=UPI003D3697B2
MKRLHWNQRKTKQILVIIVFLLTNFAVISLLSTIYYEFNSGADRSNLLHIDLKFNNYYLPKINIYTENTEGRKLNEEIIKNIREDYIKSWYVRKYALQNNDAKAIEDFYTDSAQVKIKRIINNNAKSKITIHSTSLNHNLNIRFFSEDGQVAYVNDSKVHEQTFFYQQNQLIHQEKTIKNYKAILLLEDGFWRVRHLVSDTVYKPEKDTVKTKDYPFNIKGINYYPQKKPWFKFWNAYDSLVVNKDFSLIKKLGLNAIRIFIPYEVFGKEKVLTTHLNHLKTTLDIAQKNNIKIIVTFFDFYSNYEVLDYTLCDRHLETIITHIKNHPALIQYDVKNEPDLDFKIHNKQKVINWLDFVIQQVKNYDKNTPVTIGWYAPESTSILEKKVDFISFHYYKSPEKFKDAYLMVKEKTNKPIVIQEFGRHSYNSIWNLYSHSEKKQAAYHKEMQTNFKSLGVKHFVSWTLYDFPEIDASIFGRAPYKTGPQKHYGFIDVNGQLKPSSKYIIPYAN